MSIIGWPDRAGPARLMRYLVCFGAGFQLADCGRTPAPAAACDYSRRAGRAAAKLLKYWAFRRRGHGWTERGRSVLCWPTPHADSGLMRRRGMDPLQGGKKWIVVHSSRRPASAAPPRPRRRALAAPAIAQSSPKVTLAHARRRSRRRSTRSIGGAETMANYVSRGDRRQFRHRGLRRRRDRAGPPGGRRGGGRHGRGLPHGLLLFLGQGPDLGAGDRGAVRAEVRADERLVCIMAAASTC